MSVCLSVIKRIQYGGDLLFAPRLLNCIQHLAYFYSEKDLRTNLFLSKIMNKYCWRFEYQRCSSLTVSVIFSKWGLVTYVPVKSKLKHPAGQPPGHLNFWKIFGKVPPPEAEKLFKCPIIGPFQVIKCPHPRETFQ